MRENKQTKMRNKQTKKHMESSFVLIFTNERRHYTGRITLRSMSSFETETTSHRNNQGFITIFCKTADLTCLLLMSRTPFFFHT